MSDHRHLIGLLLGTEEDWPTAFEAMMRRETLDFVQVDFALDNRGAGERLLPLARDRGMGVMINLPFGRGRLFDATRGKPLPTWAADFDCSSWAQFFLKYIISHDAVTCALPGMAKPEYVIDNMAAATGRLPDLAAHYTDADDAHRLIAGGSVQAASPHGPPLSRGRRDL